MTASRKRIHSLSTVAIAIGVRLKELRIESGVPTIVDFARKHDLPQIQYWRIENGKSNVTLKSLHKLLSIHGIEVADFFNSLKMTRDKR